MKKILLLLTILTLCFSLSITAYADEEENPSEENSYDEEYINNKLDELYGRIEALEIAKEYAEEKFNYYDMLTSDINSNLSIMITQNEELKDVFKATFYDVDSNNILDEIYINTNFDRNSITDIQNFLYAGFVVEGEELDTSDTLASKLDEMQKGITESLTVTTEKTLTELNETLLTTNTFLSYLFVIFLIIFALVITFFIGWVIYKILHRNVV